VLRQELELAADRDFRCRPVLADHQVVLAVEALPLAGHERNRPRRGALRKMWHIKLFDANQLEQIGKPASLQIDAC
jgi:hypothetical protein